MKCSARCLVVIPAVFGALFLAALGLVLFRGGYWLEALASTPTWADAIIVLGDDDEGERAKQGLDLYRAGYAPEIVLTGLQVGRYAAPASSNWRVSILEASGVPQDAISLERRASNSFQEAANILALMKASGWHSVIVVSDPPHLRRLAWTWGAAFRDSGDRYTLVSSNPEWWNAAKWWKDERAGAFVITEYIKLVYYVAKYGV